MKKIALHVQILIGIVSGLLFTFVYIKQAWPIVFVLNYIKPFGTLFLNSLKMVAMPLVFFSLLVGIASIANTKKLSRMGTKASMLYAVTTLLSGSIGIGAANIIKPGVHISKQTRVALLELYGTNVHQLALQHQQEQNKGVQLVAKLVPENVFHALSNNTHLLQVVVVSVLLGIALLKIPTPKRKPVFAFFEGLYEAIIQLIRMVMHLAPIGVFSLTTSLLVELTSQNQALNLLEVLYALLGYVGTVLIGLLLVVGVLYSIVLRLFTSMPFFHFLRGIYPAQLLAFSSSSSAAALPASMESVEKNLGVSEEISRFLLPLGATINMNGTALYQAVICIFIAQAMGIECSIGTQCLIIGHVTIASLGVAGAPGSALVTTTALLESVGIPAAGLSLVLAPDRLLDMCRTVVNITGDALAAVVVAKTEQKASLTDAAILH